MKHLVDQQLHQISTEQFTLAARTAALERTVARCDLLSAALRRVLDMATPYVLDLEGDDDTTTTERCFLVSEETIKMARSTLAPWHSSA